MKSCRSVLGSAFLAAFMTMLAACVHAAPRLQISWAPDVPTAQQEAKAQHKMLLVDFYTDWCGWCKVLDAKVYPDPKVVAAAQPYVAVKVNAEQEGAQLAQEYHVAVYPTILLFDDQGNLLNKMIGYQPAEQFAKSIIRAHDDYIDEPVLALKLAQNPQDVQAKLELAMIYARGVRVDQAVVYGMELEKAGRAAEAGPLDSAIAGDLLNDQVWQPARTYYLKALRQGLAGDDLVDCHIGILNADLGLQDLQGVKNELKAISRLPAAPRDLRASARATLHQVEMSGLSALES